MNSQTRQTTIEPHAQTPFQPNDRRGPDDILAHFLATVDADQVPPRDEEHARDLWNQFETLKEEGVL